MGESGEGSTASRFRFGRFLFVGMAAILSVASIAWACVSHPGTGDHHAITVAEDRGDRVGYSSGCVSPTVNGSCAVNGGGARAEEGDSVVSEVDLAAVSGTGLSGNVGEDFYIHFSPANSCGGAANNTSEWEVTGAQNGPSFVVRWTVPNDSDIPPAGGSYANLRHGK